MKRILLIDDALDIQEWVADYLRNHGIYVQACANGAQAMKELQKEQYDTIITDLNMPHEDGISVIYKIKNNIAPLNKQTPIIVITGNASGSDGNFVLNSLEKLGIQTLQKPFHPDDILAAVCNALNIDIQDVASLLTA